MTGCLYPLGHPPNRLLSVFPGGLLRTPLVLLTGHSGDPKTGGDGGAGPGALAEPTEPAAERAQQL